MADETAAGNTGCRLQLQSPKNTCFASLFTTQTLTMPHLVRIVPNRHAKGLAANVELHGWHGADAAAVKGHVERIGQLLTQGQGLHASQGTAGESIGDRCVRPSGAQQHTRSDRQRWLLAFYSSSELDAHHTHWHTGRLAPCPLTRLTLSCAAAMACAGELGACCWARNSSSCTAPHSTEPKESAAFAPNMLLHTCIASRHTHNHTRVSVPGKVSCSGLVSCRLF